MDTMQGVALEALLRQQVVIQTGADLKEYEIVHTNHTGQTICTICVPILSEPTIPIERIPRAARRWRVAVWVGEHLPVWLGGRKLRRWAWSHFPMVKYVPLERAEVAFQRWREPDVDLDVSFAICPRSRKIFIAA